jgi:predicted nucleic acid-binding protein
MTFVDTSVLVRYLTGDPPKMQAAAKRIMDSSHVLSITDVVLVETAYVLQSFYKVPRAVLVDSLIELVQKKNVEIYSLQKDKVIRALLFCRPSHRVSFADALVWAAALQESATVYTFDERFPSEGLTVKSEL